jgi:hypothetical protein
MNFPIFSFVYFLLCGITGLVLWIQMLSIIQSKGIKTNYSVLTPGQYIKFWRLIQDEADERNKRKYRRLFWVQIALIPIYLGGFFLLLPFG